LLRFFYIIEYVSDLSNNTHPRCVFYVEKIKSKKKKEKENLI